MKRKPTNPYQGTRLQPGRTLTVTVPKDHKDGAPLEVSLADGTVLNVPIPRGKRGKTVALVEDPKKPWKVVPAKKETAGKVGERSVKLKIPKGMKAGDMLEVVLPGGDAVMVPVPEGRLGTVVVREDPANPWKKPKPTVTVKIPKNAKAGQELMITTGRGRTTKVKVPKGGAGKTFQIPYSPPSPQMAAAHKRFIEMIRKGAEDGTEEALRACFEELDEDKSGSLDTEEFTQALGLLDVPAKDAELLLGFYDADDDKTISWEEFIAAVSADLAKPPTEEEIRRAEAAAEMSRLLKQTLMSGGSKGQKTVAAHKRFVELLRKRVVDGTVVEEVLREAFEDIDADKSGTLSQEEFIEAVDLLDGGVSEADCKLLLSFYDTDLSGDVSYDEFVAAVAADVAKPITEEGEGRATAGADLARILKEQLCIPPLALPKRMELEAAPGPEPGAPRDDRAGAGLSASAEMLAMREENARLKEQLAAETAEKERLVATLNERVAGDLAAEVMEGVLSAATAVAAA